MIFTDRTITVRKGESKINEPIIVYRGDYELEIRFTISNSKFKFKNGTNLIESEKASHGQLVILTPYGGNIFSDIVKCNEGTVSFLLTKEMLDQIEEIGLYSFQIRLFDYYRESRITIPPIEYGIEIREPITSEDHDNTVNNAIVGYSIAKVVNPKEENVGPTFDDNGQYNKTDWETGDRISEGKLNKMEDALYQINQNEKNDVAALDKRVTSNYNALNAVKADKNEVFSMKNMGQDIKEAMTGGSVAVVGESSVDTINIVNKSITSDKIANQYLYNILFYEDATPPDFTFDYGNKVLKLTLPITCYIIVGHKYILVGDNNRRKTINIPYPSSQHGINTLWWSAELNEFQLLNYSDYNNAMLGSNKEKYLIASIGIATGSTNSSVVMPGNYTINGKTYIKNDSITSSNIQNNSILADDLSRQIQPIKIFTNGTIQAEFEGTGLKLTFPRNSYLMFNTSWSLICEDSTTYTIPYPSCYDGINVLCYDLRNRGFIIVNYTEISYVNSNVNDVLVIGTVGIGEPEKRSLYLPADFKIAEAPLQSKEFFLTFNGNISVNTYSKKIRIPTFFVQRAGMGHKEIKGSACGLNTDYFEYSYSNQYDIHMICLNYDKVVNWINNPTSPNENPIEVYTKASMPSTSSLKNNLKVIATSVYGHVTSEYNLDVIGGPKNLEWTSFNSVSPIDFDWTKKEITYKQGYVHYRNNYIEPRGNEIGVTYTIPISNVNDGIQWLLFNIEERTFRTCRYAEDTIDWNQRWVIIATFWIGRGVQTLSRYSINGKIYGITVEQQEFSIPKFEETKARLLLPDTIYLVKGEKIPVYMSSVIPIQEQLRHISPSVWYSYDGEYNLDNFVDGYDLDTNKIQASGVGIGYTQNEDGKVYYKSIKISNRNTNSISNKTPTILHIGDSITNRNIASRSEIFLKKWGITPTYVGTMVNGSKRGEGREGWEYTNFIGMSNIWGNNNSIINVDVNNTTSNLNLNPFVKIATDSDKANYPDWCFTHTGSLRETSYTNAEDKSQTFYIFDMTNYLSAHSVNTPDIITIALSTNDISRRDDYLETCLFSMDVMISRIKEQLPNVKIGIVPSPAWGHRNDAFANRTANWIEECIAAIKSKNYDNVFIVPIWCHMHRVWGFPINGAALSDTNSSIRGTLSDTIHPSEYGQQQYAKAMAMFIANML